jgi:hypothetical protein
MNPPDQKIAARIALLEEFISLVATYSGSDEEDEEDVLLGIVRAPERATRSKLLRMVMSARAAVIDAGVGTVVAITPPATLGGYVQNVDVFENLFRNTYGFNLARIASEMAEKAIGVYEAVAAGTLELPLRGQEALDIMTAINRALRPSFKLKPTSEKEVQDAVENILRAIGIDYHREKERAALGPTTFIPDFTIPSIELALEVKFATETLGAAKIQHEMAEDIAGYSVKWKRLLFVVYDGDGVIADPDQLRRANEATFGVSVLIVKH